MNYWCQYANTESNMILLLTTELLRTIVNLGATISLQKLCFSGIFNDFCLKRTHTTKKPTKMSREVPVGKSLNYIIDYRTLPINIIMFDSGFAYGNHMADFC